MSTNTIRYRDQPQPRPEETFTHVPNAPLRAEFERQEVAFGRDHVPDDVFGGPVRAGRRGIPAAVDTCQDGREAVRAVAEDAARRPGEDCLAV